jgi:tRNA uridine 5-carbamoylmethylation protein Kti12
MRTNKVILIAGTRGTGKTDFVKNLIAKQRKNFDKCLIVDTFDSPVWLDLSTHDFPNRMELVPVLSKEQFPRWKKGTARMFDSNTNEIITIVEQHAKNTFVVFEDATRYVA